MDATGKVLPQPPAEVKKRKIEEPGIHPIGSNSLRLNLQAYKKDGGKT